MPVPTYCEEAAIELNMARVAAEANYGGTPKVSVYWPSD
jgi:hypothetical protein